jgi:hypothetical protein
MKPLAYVLWFSPRQYISGLQIYRVSRSKDDETPQRRGIIELDSIARFIQLIPDFGPAISASLDANNSADTWPHYFINCFADKEIYQAVW